MVVPKAGSRIEIQDPPHLRAEDGVAHYLLEHETEGVLLDLEQNRRHLEHNRSEHFVTAEPGCFEP